MVHLFLLFYVEHILCLIDRPNNEYPAFRPTISWSRSRERAATRSLVTHELQASCNSTVL